jgi:hypothetical protein
MSVSGLMPGFGHVVAQQEVVHLYSKGTANLKPFQFFGSRLSLCLLASVMAWPLMFWMVATFIGVAALPRPIEMASGIGLRKCVASYSLFSILSRISAQPAVFTSCTFRPCWR